MNFYWLLMRKVAEKEKSLTELIRKNTKWIWTKEREESFLKLQQEFSRDQFLQSFKEDKETIIKTDAFNIIIAGVLQQERKLIAFYSKWLLPAEQNYTITEKEMLAVIQEVKTWRHYLKEIKRVVKILTDHKNLEYFSKARIQNSR